MYDINDFTNPFDAIKAFEGDICNYTGSPYAIATDSCSSAIMLCFRYLGFPNEVALPAHTYISVPMLFHAAGVHVYYKDIDWLAEGEYNIIGTNVWDSARRLEEDMYRPGHFQCLSFGHSKPLQIGRGGMILTDNEEAYNWLKRASFDGRDPNKYYWGDQEEFEIGYHCRMLPEEAIIGANMLAEHDINKFRKYHSYPDLRKIKIRGRYDK